MATDEQRREVAARLRVMAADRNREEAAQWLLDYVFGRNERWYDALPRLADLIEPEPTRGSKGLCYGTVLMRTQLGLFIVTECGEEFELSEGRANYCPKCGKPLVMCAGW